MRHPTEIGSFGEPRQSHEEKDMDDVKRFPNRSSSFIDSSNMLDRETDADNTMQSNKIIKRSEEQLAKVDASCRR